VAVPASAGDLSYLGFGLLNSGVCDLLSQVEDHLEKGESLRPPVLSGQRASQHVTGLGDAPLELALGRGGDLDGRPGRVLGGNRIRVLHHEHGFQAVELDQVEPQTALAGQEQPFIQREPGDLELAFVQRNPGPDQVVKAKVLDRAGMKDPLGRGIKRFGGGGLLANSVCV
jgi:hypothetical protein